MVQALPNSGHSIFSLLFSFSSFQIKEMFGAGTACVVCPVNRILYEGQVRKPLTSLTCSICFLFEASTRSKQKLLERRSKKLELAPSALSERKKLLRRVNVHTLSTCHVYQSNNHGKFQTSVTGSLKK